MNVVLYIVSCIAAYGFMGGLTYRLSVKRDKFTDDDMHFVAGMFWFLALPAALGSIVANATYREGVRQTKAEKRRALEVAEAMHRKDLARIDAEAIAIHEQALNIK